VTLTEARKACLWDVAEVGGITSVHTEQFGLLCIDLLFARSLGWGGSHVPTFLPPIPSEAAECACARSKQLQRGLQRASRIA
jgi:hypothetical protein